MFSKNNYFYNNYINIAYSVDNIYHYIAHVSMKSIMLSQKPTTFINFYILCSNITDEQKEVINRISSQHKNCKIEYIDVGDQFKEFKIPKHKSVLWTTATFYRMLLPILFPKEKKMLFLDADTLIYKDLNKIYNYNITDKYYIGMLEYKIFGKYFKEKFDNFINTGVLLCNLEELRKGNILEKFIEFHKTHDKIDCPVNDAVNIVSHEKNGFFPPEYVVIGFCNEQDAQEYYSKAAIKINQTAVVKAFKDPYIYHMINYGKPWIVIPRKNKKKICVDLFTRFYEMSRKTDFYYTILKIFEIE